MIQRMAKKRNWSKDGRLSPAGVALLRNSLPAQSCFRFHNQATDYANRWTIDLPESFVIAIAPMGSASPPTWVGADAPPTVSRSDGFGGPWVLEVGQSPGSASQNFILYRQKGAAFAAPSSYLYRDRSLRIENGVDIDAHRSASGPDACA